MKNILQVLKFEYFSCVKNKAFIFTTVLLMVMILLFSFLPAIIMGITSSSDDSEGNTEKPVIAIVDNAYNDDSLIKSEFGKSYNNYDIVITDEEQDTLKNKVDSQEYEFAVIINTPVQYTYITKNNSFNIDSISSPVDDTISSIYKVNALEQFGISSDKADEILNVKITSQTISTGTDQTKNYISTFILIMVLYMAIIMYGQLVSNSVITEKNSRAMEMLITCAKPSQLMFGKIFGAGLAGLTQLGTIALTAIVSMGAIGSSSMPSELSSMFSFPISTIIYALLFFILAFFIYSFLLGALSSLASRTEDLNTLLTPVMLLFVAAFMIVMFSVNYGSVDSTLMQVCSYIPFTAPIAMFARIAMSDVAVWEIILSVAIQLVSIYLLGMLAAAIYRMGVLMYGKPPKFSEIIKMLKEQHKQNKKIRNS